MKFEPLRYTERIMRIKYPGGKSFDIYCTGTGIDSMGVSRPDKSMNISKKKNIMNMVCCNVSEILARSTENADITIMNNTAPSNITHR